MNSVSCSVVCGSQHIDAINHSFIESVECKCGPRNSLIHSFIHSRIQHQRIGVYLSYSLSFSSLLSPSHPLSPFSPPLAPYRTCMCTRSYDTTFICNACSLACARLLPPLATDAGNKSTIETPLPLFNTFLSPVFHRDRARALRREPQILSASRPDPSLRWRGGGEEVEKRWRGGGEEVERRWRGGRWRRDGGG